MSNVLCGVCDKLVSKAALWAHISHDLNYRPFSCKTCNAKFSTATELAHHVANSTGHIGDFNPIKNKLKEETIGALFLVYIKVYESTKRKGMAMSTEPILKQNMALSGAREASSPETNASSIGRSSTNGVNETPRNKNESTKEKEMTKNTEPTPFKRPNNGILLSTHQPPHKKPQIQPKNIAVNGGSEASSPEINASSIGRANSVNEISRHKNGFII